MNFVMMDKIFLTVLNMSLTASFVIVVVLLVRLFLRRAPKVISYALWAVVLFNLLCPFKPESVFSLIPFNPEPIPINIAMQPIPRIDSGIPFINAAVSSALPAATPEYSVNPLQIWTAIGVYVWVLGAAALIIYTIIGYIRLKQRVSLAIRVEDNIYETDMIDSPFVLGLFPPRIYIPTGMEAALTTHIIEHERTHIKRRDYLVSIIAYSALALHWFNPLVWVAYMLMLRDMESSCDEAVLRKSTKDVRREYSSALLNFSNKRGQLSFPLAFGEQGVKTRIKNVLNFRKPSRWIIAVAIVLVTVLSVHAG